MKAFVIFIACCCLLIGCRKSRTANELVGEWKLIEEFRVGQPWQPISAAQELTLTFHNNYTFTQRNSHLSSSIGCNGTYRLSAGNTLIMTYVCSPTTSYEDELGFTRVGNTLILDHRTTGSGLKTKYTKQ